MSLSREEIIRMAIQCGINGYNFSGDANALSDFFNTAYAAGSAAEREACAKVCDAQASEPECPERAAYCAEAIRAHLTGGGA